MMTGPSLTGDEDAGNHGSVAPVVPESVLDSYAVPDTPEE
jgi:hypothetical protein